MKSSLNQIYFQRWIRFSMGRSLHKAFLLLIYLVFKLMFLQQYRPDLSRHRFSWNLVTRRKTSWRNIVMSILKQSPGVPGTREIAFNLGSSPYTLTKFSIFIIAFVSFMNVTTGKGGHIQANGLENSFGVLHQMRDNVNFSKGLVIWLFLQNTTFFLVCLDTPIEVSPYIQEALFLQWRRHLKNRYC